MDKKVHLYIGTYTMPIQFGTGQILEGKGKGIYHTFLTRIRVFFPHLSYGLKQIIRPSWQVQKTVVLYMQ